MTNESLLKFWPLIYSTVKEFWSITEPRIEDASVQQGIPIELYYYSELGLEYFSIPDFQKRDRSEEHTSELQSQSNLVCRLLLEKKKKKQSGKRGARLSRSIHRVTCTHDP